MVSALSSETVQWAALLVGYAVILAGIGFGYVRGWSLLACAFLLLVVGTAWLVAFVYLVNHFLRGPVT